MNGRFTAVMPTITAGSVNMISSGCGIAPIPIRLALRSLAIAERNHPARRPHRVADEERQHDEHDKEISEARPRAREDIGEWKAHQEAIAVVAKATRTVRQSTPV